MASQGTNAEAIASPYEDTFAAPLASATVDCHSIGGAGRHLPVAVTGPGLDRTGE